MKSSIMKSKKVLAVVLTSILALSTFTGCGNAKSQETTAEEMTAEQTTSEMETVKQEESTQQEDSESAAGDNGTVREDLTALEVAKLMGNGTNLGIYMCMSKTNRINFRRSNRQFAVFVCIAAFFHTAVNKDMPSASLKQGARACNLMSCSYKC